MPVGGDVTGFFIGLMSFLGESYRAGRLPLWNDLWGYGFAGVSESQMGVFYPPHWLCYRWFAVETAYVLSLVAHTVVGAIGVFWLGRRLALSPMAASLAAVAWSASGFALIHLAHPWGYTTGCWMPWALGLAWMILSQEGGPGLLRRSLGLGLVLALQMLPGHFQLAFQTQVAIAILVGWLLLENLARRLRRGGDPGSRTYPALGVGRGSLVVSGVLFAFALASSQLLPTARLARLASDQRGFEYLSGFASTPFHLVSWVAPGLFHRSRLWRPIVWDPFHTSPEENLAYVGLVPFFLAILALGRLSWRDRAVRALGALAAISLFLSLGPYVPGFRILIELPGFSFFRAPARWTLVTSLAVSLLAGKGLDGWLSWRKPARGLAALSAVGIGWIALTLAVLELAIAWGGSASSSGISRGFDRAFQLMPWEGDPPFAAVIARVSQPDVDSRIPAGAPPSVALRKSVKPSSLALERVRIYTRELGETAVLFAVLLAVAMLASRFGPRRTQAALLTLAIADLLVLSRHRLVDVAPLRSLVEQSPVLRKLASEPRGTRVAAHLGNLPIRAGADTLAAYRTLNLPALESLTALAGSLAVDSSGNSGAAQAQYAAGVGVRLFDPVELRTLELVHRDPGPIEIVEDPTLASWLFGADWVAEQGSWVRRFGILRNQGAPVRAWFIPETADLDLGILAQWSGDVREILALVREAFPLLEISSTPEQSSILVDTDEPGWIMISRLHDPQWSASWADEDGTIRDAEILSACPQASRAGGWQRIRVENPGRSMLELEYLSDDVELGIGLSILAGSSWLVLFACTHLPVRSRAQPTPVDRV